MTQRTSFTLDEARRVGESIGIDWAAAPFDAEQFRMGMDVELEHGLHPIAFADHLIAGGRRGIGRARLEIGMVLPAKTDEPPPPLLEKADDVVDLIEGADTETGIVTAARIGPAAVALLAPRGERHDLGTALRPAARSARDRYREADFIE